MQPRASSSQEACDAFFGVAHVCRRRPNNDRIEAECPAQPQGIYTPILSEMTQFLAPADIQQLTSVSRSLRASGPEIRNGYRGSLDWDESPKFELYGAAPPLDHVVQALALFQNVSSIRLRLTRNRPWTGMIGYALSRTTRPGLVHVSIEVFGIGDGGRTNVYQFVPNDIRTVWPRLESLALQGMAMWNYDPPLYLPETTRCFRWVEGIMTDGGVHAPGLEHAVIQDFDDFTFLAPMPRLRTIRFQTVSQLKRNLPMMPSVTTVSILDGDGFGPFDDDDGVHVPNMSWLEVWNGNHTSGSSLFKYLGLAALATIRFLDYLPTSPSVDLEMPESSDDLYPIVRGLVRIEADLVYLPFWTEVFRRYPRLHDQVRERILYVDNPATTPPAIGNDLVGWDIRERSLAIHRRRPYGFILDDSCRGVPPFLSEEEDDV